MLALFIELRKRVLGILIAEDEAVNAALGSDPDVPAAGNPHFTVSQRLAFMRLKGNKVGCVGCKILTWIFEPLNLHDPDYDHCAEAIKDFPPDLPSDG